jgi:hydrogenase maturation protease
VTGPTLVLGLGNVLLGDEGLGVWVAESLRRRFEFPSSVTILDGGTLGLDLLPRLDGVDRLLMIDAVRSGGVPGDLVRLEGDAVGRALDIKISPHQVGVQELLAAARLTGREPSLVALCGMEPERLEPGTGFSPRVREGLPRLQARVLDELRRWGVPGEPRERPVAPPVWWEAPMAGSPR